MPHRVLTYDTHEVNPAVQRLKQELHRGDVIEAGVTGVRQPDGRWLWKVRAVRTEPDLPKTNGGTAT